jgi:hypothetical protein
MVRRARDCSSWPRNNSRAGQALGAVAADESYEKDCAQSGEEESPKLVADLRREVERQVERLRGRMMPCPSLPIPEKRLSARRRAL